MVNLRSTVFFLDRADAARQLVAALAHYRGTNPLVLAVPRGGVPIGRVVADELGGELDVVLVRKLVAPQSPELAVGAVDENGVVLMADYVHRMRVDPDYVARQAEKELALIRERRRRYRPQTAPLDPRGRTAIVVDDGLATGSTMRAALAAVRAKHPRVLVCAVPVAAQESLKSVATLADDVVCLSSPSDFYAVSRFYAHFDVVDDTEVTALLANGPSADSSARRSSSSTIGSANDAAG